MHLLPGAPPGTALAKVAGSLARLPWSFSGSWPSRLSAGISSSNEELDLSIPNHHLSHQGTARPLRESRSGELQFRGGNARDSLGDDCPGRVQWGPGVQPGCALLSRISGGNARSAGARHQRSGCLYRFFRLRRLRLIRVRRSAFGNDDSRLPRNVRVAGQPRQRNAAAQRTASDEGIRGEHHRRRRGAKPCTGGARR
jgi:hypothetical protein